MTDEIPMMMLLLQSHSFLGAAEKVENEVMPLDSQLGLGPGDVAVVAHAGTPLERDLTIVKVVDAGQYAEEFPDWEERVLMKSYLLCDAFSASDPEPHLGWYSRLKLLPITRYRYYQARKWQKNSFPDEFPDWVINAHDEYQDVLADRAPERVPRPLVCEQCGKRDIALTVDHRAIYQGRAGQLIIDGKLMYVPLKEADVNETTFTHLVCRKCGWRSRPLNDDQWTLPGITN